MRLYAWLRCVWLPSLCLTNALVAGLGQTSTACGAPRRGVAVLSGIVELKVPSQNWSDDEAEWFYSVPQGSHLIPYRWFLHLEQPDSEKLFRDSEHIWSLGYLPRVPEQPQNPDGLPVGFAKDGEHLGLNCAACHSALIQYQDKAWLIDGGPTLGNVETLLRRLTTSLEQTFLSDAKFERFAKGVLGRNASSADKASLKSQLKEVRDIRHGYNERNMPAAGSPSFGPGRVDAIGAIMNEVVTTFAQQPNNFALANAPVSYPFLWDTPQHDYVQWNGSAPNIDLLLAKAALGTIHVGALSRNAGEVLGVFGEVNAEREGNLVELGGYPSTVNKPNLVRVEESLRKLWSPQWPADFPAINETLRSKGKALFQNHCAECHQSIRRDAPDRTVRAQMQAVGTDQTMASNFALRRSRSGILEGRKFLITGLRTLQAEEPTKDLLIHMVLRVVVEPLQGINLLDFASDHMLVLNLDELTFPVYAEVSVGDRKLFGAFERLTVNDGKVQKARAWSRHALVFKEAGKLFRQDLSGVDPLRLFTRDGEHFSLDQWAAVRLAGNQLNFIQPATVQFAYKARPLNGIWATAPYLHNGSVPNLDELLKPANDRLKHFRVGSREFDPNVVGFRSDAGESMFDATLPGNSNAGHEYNVEFTETERKQLIEYMKSL